MKPRYSAPRLNRGFPYGTTTFRKVHTRRGACILFSLPPTPMAAMMTPSGDAPLKPQPEETSIRLAASASPRLPRPFYARQVLQSLPCGRPCVYPKPPVLSEPARTKPAPAAFLDSANGYLAEGPKRACNPQAAIVRPIIGIDRQHLAYLAIRAASLRAGRPFHAKPR
jgi:hypothetical protein